MKASPDTPSWALALVDTVCTEAGVAPPARLRWARRDRERSSGVTRHAAGFVGVVAGTDEADTRQTLLHELAHWLTPPPPRRRRPAGLVMGYALLDPPAIEQGVRRLAACVAECMAAGGGKRQR